MKSQEWLNDFDKNPHKAIKDLFSGRAGIGSSLYFGKSDFLFQEFRTSSNNEKLSDALYAWLTYMKKNQTIELRKLGFSVYGKRINECILTAKLLDLDGFGLNISRDMAKWMPWLGSLRTRQIDPEKECRRLLDQLSIISFKY